jgi:adenylate kinase family enzyme
MAQRLYITDAPGSGRTTLSAALAKTLGCSYLDTNDFYWLPADPLFRTKWHTNERLSLAD